MDTHVIHNKKGNNITYSESMFVALVIQHVMRMRPVLVSCLASPTLHHFSTLSLKRHDFQNKIFEHAKCVLILSTTSLWKIYNSKKNWGGTRWRSLFRHCATSRKVVGSISDGVTGIFNWHNPSGRTMALGLTQPLTAMSTRNISWGVKAAGA